MGGGLGRADTGMMIDARRSSPEIVDLTDELDDVYDRDSLRYSCIVFSVKGRAGVLTYLITKGYRFNPWPSPESIPPCRGTVWAVWQCRKVQTHLVGTPLHLAVSRNRFEHVRNLLEHNAEFTVGDSAGLSPLDLAKQMNSSQGIIEVLGKADLEMTVTV